MKNYLFHDPRESSPLESNTGIPLFPQRLFHRSLELGTARIRIWKIFDKVLGSFLVLLFRNDDMFLVVIGSRFWVDTCYLLYPI
jgi:hypothetical protein